MPSALSIENHRTVGVVSPASTASRAALPLSTASQKLFFRKAFPTMVSAVSVRNDGWAQRGGIDRVITLPCGRVFTVDEKVRTTDWSDILWSSGATKGGARPAGCRSRWRAIS